jgi:chemotaxis signal transduction protein
MPAVAALPGAPAWFRGMANLQGRLLPVFDLARFAGLPETRPHQLLLLGRGADAAGITIDAVPQRLRFAATALRPPAAVPLALRGCVGQACVVDGHEWLTLHTDRLLDALSLHDAPGPRA